MPGERARSKQSLTVAATSTNGVEAELLQQRLAQGGVPAIVRRAVGDFEMGSSGGHSLLVAPEHLERAREILAAPADISDEELAQMAEDAGRPQ
jgi:hypothetical protein